jgi:hypothetical protein
MLTGGVFKMVIQYQNKLFVPFKTETYNIDLQTTTQTISLDPEKVYMLSNITVLSQVPAEAIKIVGTGIKNPFGDHLIQFYAVLGKKLQFSRIFCENSIKIIPVGTTTKKFRFRMVELKQISLDPQAISHFEWSDDILYDNRFLQFQGEIYEEKKFTSKDTWKIPKSDYDMVQLSGYSCQKQTVYHVDNNFPDLNMKIYVGDNIQTDPIRKHWPKSCDVAGTEKPISPKDFSASKFGGGIQGGIYFPASQGKGTTLDDFHSTTLDGEFIPGYEEISIKIDTHKAITTFDAIVGIHMAYFSSKN